MAISAFSWVVELPNPNTHQNDDGFFLQALEEAYFCVGSTHPNPSVGAVIVKNGDVIAKGHTQPVGGLHGEASALKNATADVRGGSMYVTLEPCSHFGRTPPCVDAIIKAGISEVIYGTPDPNPRVDGQGILALKKAGIVVRRIHNLSLQEKADALIAPFRKYALAKEPYVILKIATSADGKLNAQVGARTKITGPKADRMVHELRRAADCVMVGANTVRIDNPQLTARLGQNRHGAQPKRVVLSTSLNNLPQNLHIFDPTAAPTWLCVDESLAASRRALFEASGLRIIPCAVKEGRILLKPMLAQLAVLGITSVLVEAGGHMFRSFMESLLVDELWWFRSSKNFGVDGMGVSLSPEAVEEQGFVCLHDVKLGEDRLQIFRPQKIISQLERSQS